MKKVVLSLAVLFSVALVSCGGQKAEAVDTDSMEAVEMTEDTVAADSVAADTVVADSTVVAE